MANPSRIPDPRLNDPANPSTPVGVDPLSSDPRLNPANSQDPRVVDNRNVVESRGAGSGVLIAAVVLVLAIIAYFVFAPGTDTAVTPTDDTVTTEPATPAPDATAPAPDATAPAPDATAPADPATPAPDATAPEAPADPATPAPDATAPAEPAPAPAEPAPAPAQ
jgi:hypothetical protein